MLSLPPLGALLLTLTPLLQSTLASEFYQTSNNTTPKDNNANCSCYVVNTGKKSAQPSYFQYYRFYDFRNLNEALTSSPPLVNNSQNASECKTWQANIFHSDAWNADWGVQSWSKPADADSPVPMSNSAANVFIGAENNVSYLSLRTARTENAQNAAEIESQQKNLMHLSMRMYARVIGSKGAVAGFFTYFDDDNESDIEILTDDPTNQIRYTNQPSLDKKGNVITKASVGPTNLPPWNEWQLHRIDWLPKESYWYINGQQVAANTYSVPRKPSFVMMNMWSDGGVWSGNMSVGNYAELQIQWIDMTFNTSGPPQGPNADRRRWDESEAFNKRKAPGCDNVCAIDKVTDVGTPEVVHSGTSPRHAVSWGLWAFVVLVSVVAAQ